MTRTSPFEPTSTARTARRATTGHRPRRLLVGLVGLVVLALLALAGTGCAAEPDDGGSGTGGGTAGGGTPDRDQAVAFARCMRDNGIATFPDPDASGELTIDAVANRAGVDTSAAAFDQALAACEDLEPAGFTGPGTVTPEQQDTRLAFARCIREHGVPDFPDPAPDAPLVDTNRIPSLASDDADLTVLDAAMATCGDLAAAAMEDR